MPTLTPPRLEITGHPTGTTWTADPTSLDTPVALADINLAWGVESILDDQPAATLQVTLIDRDGTFAADTELRQRRVTLSYDRTDGTGAVVLFRGTIQRATLAPTAIRDPTHLARNLDVWKVQLSCSDDSLALAADQRKRDIRFGSTWMNGVPNYFQQSGSVPDVTEATPTAINRHLAIASALAAHGVDFPQPPALSGLRVRGFAASDTPSILALATRLNNLAGPCLTSLRPTSDGGSLERVAIPTTSTRPMQLPNGTWTVGDADHLISADAVAPDNLTVELPVTGATNRIAYQRYTQNPTFGYETS